MEAPRQPPKQTVGTAQQGLKIRLFTLPKEATETGFFLSQKLYLYRVSILVAFSNLIEG